MRHYDGGKIIERSRVPGVYLTAWNITYGDIVLLYYVSPKQSYEALPFHVYGLHPRAYAAHATLGSKLFNGRQDVLLRLVTRYGYYAGKGVAYRDILSWAWPKEWGAQDSRCGI